MKKFLDFIYKDATVWLERKHDRYITLTNIINTREEIVINKKYKCDLCGNENSSNYIQWKGGEYDGYTLCYKHYQQMKKNGYIIPDKKDHCEICGDMNGSLIQVGKKYLEYRGMTLCKKHYNQLYIHGSIKDNIKGEHKNVG